VTEVSIVCRVIFHHGSRRRSSCSVCRSNWCRSCYRLLVPRTARICMCPSTYSQSNRYSLHLGKHPTPVHARYPFRLRSSGADVTKLLGLTEQAPMRLAFLTNGASRALQVGNLQSSLSLFIVSCGGDWLTASGRFRPKATG
jgi:hypothetical protein